MHHFDNVGLYDALFVMQDQESKTLWNHITGEALYGPMVGHTLGPISNQLQMNVAQALVLDPRMEIAISDRMYFAGGQQFGTAGGFGRGAGNAGGAPAAGRARGRAGSPPGRGRAGAPAGRGAGRGRGLSDDAQLAAFFVDTLGQEDTRRPRMELGLGIWTDQTLRYYPLERIREHGDAFVDELDGRKLLVYIDPDTNTPAALFADAGSATIEGEAVQLDNGVVLRAGVAYDAAGQRIAPERPQQMFTRWYGFALTFPGPEIYGE